MTHYEYYLKWISTLKTDFLKDAVTEVILHNLDISIDQSDLNATRNNSLGKHEKMPMHYYEGRKAEAKAMREYLQEQYDLISNHEL